MLIKCNHLNRIETSPVGTLLVREGFTSLFNPEHQEDVRFILKTAIKGDKKVTNTRQVNFPSYKRLPAVQVISKRVILLTGRPCKTTPKLKRKKKRIRCIMAG